MKVFELQSGHVKHFVAATDDQDAYEQGTDPERFPDINYLPFTITEVTVPGHTIAVTAEQEEATAPRRGRRPAAS